MSNNDLTTIDLLRHGELKTKGLFCALPGEPLSDKGWQAMLEATHNKQWDVIISSNYRRCSSFATTLAKNQKSKDFSISNKFQEMDFGRWMGTPAKDIWQNEPNELRKLWSKPEAFSAPDGESIKNFNTRIALAMDDTLKQYQGKSILIISHSGVIRSLLTMALKISSKSALKFTVDYAQMTRLHHYADGEFSLQSFGSCTNA